MSRFPSLGICFVLAASSIAGADDPPPDDLKARELFDRVVKVYRALPAYSDQGKVTLFGSKDGKPWSDTLPNPLAFGRPNRLVTTIGEGGPVGVICDGKTLNSRMGKEFHAAAAPPRLTPSAFDGNPAFGPAPDLTGTMPFVAPYRAPQWLLFMLLAEDPAMNVIPAGTRFRFEPERVADAGAKVLVMDLPGIARFRLQIDPATNLAAWIDYSRKPELPAEGGGSYKIQGARRDSGPIVTTPLDPKMFAFWPPDKGVRVETLGEVSSGPIVTDPKARELLDAVARAYKGLKAYADHGEQFAPGNQPGGRGQRDAEHLAFERPNKLAFDSDSVRVRCDGTMLMVVNIGRKQYVITEAPKVIDAAFVESPLLKIMGGSGTYLLKPFLFGDDAVREWLRRADGRGMTIALDKERVRDGRSFPVLLFRGRWMGIGYRWVIDPRTYLIVRSEDINDAVPKVPGCPEEEWHVDNVWDGGVITTDSPGPETFRVTPPAGYERVEPKEVKP